MAPVQTPQRGSDGKGFPEEGPTAAASAASHSHPTAARMGIQRNHLLWGVFEVRAGQTRLTHGKQRDRFADVFPTHKRAHTCREERLLQGQRGRQLAPSCPGNTHLISPTQRGVKAVGVVLRDITQVDCFPSRCKALGSIPRTEKVIWKKKKKLYRISV